MNTQEKVLSGLYATMGFLVGLPSGKAMHDIYDNPEVAKFMGSYQHDIAAPFGVYFIMKLVNKDRSILSRAIMVFSLYSAGEIAQGLHLYPGTFDPKDFLAYATGVGLAAAFDKLTFKNKNLETKVKEGI